MRLLKQYAIQLSQLEIDMRKISALAHTLNTNYSLDENAHKYLAEILERSEKYLYDKQ